MLGAKTRKVQPTGFVKKMPSPTSKAKSSASQGLTLSPALSSNQALTSTAMLKTAPPPILKAGVDLACKIGDVLIIFGWVKDDEQPLKSVQLGGLAKDVSTSLHRFARPDVNRQLQIDTGHPCGFLLLTPAAKSAPGGTLTLDNGLSSKLLTYQLAQKPGASPIFQSYITDLTKAAGALGFVDLKNLLLKHSTTLTHAIEGLSGRHICGFVNDSSDPGHTFTVLLTENDKIVGFGHTSLHDDSGRLGRFRIPLSDELCDGRTHAFVLKLSEPEIALGTLKVVTPLQRRPNELEKIQNKLEAIELVLKDIRNHLPHIRQQEAFDIEDYDLYFSARYAETALKRAEWTSRIGAFKYRPLISVLLPVRDPSLRNLDATIRSLQNQVYQQWELCLVDAGSKDDAVRELVKRHAKYDPRIRYVLSDKAIKQGAATVKSLDNAKGEYAMIMNAEGALSFEALALVVQHLQNQQYQVLYGDEDVIAEDATHLNPKLKPRFNYDLLLSCNYIGNATVFNIPALKQIGGIDLNFGTAWLTDCVLKLYEDSGRKLIEHIPQVIYHGYELQAVAPIENGENYSDLVEVKHHDYAKSIQAHLDRIKTGAKTTPLVLTQKSGREIEACRIQWPLPTPLPLVSIIIPTKNSADLVKNCIESITSLTQYAPYEILLVDHDSTEASAKNYFTSLKNAKNIRVIPYTGAFNWSAINNHAVTHARGSLLCFLNNDTKVISPDWLSEMVSHALRQNIGAVGAKLLYEDDTIQHAGTCLGVYGVAGHYFEGKDDRWCEDLRAVVAQNISAVTAACLVCRKSIYEEVGGFDSVNLTVAYNDVDFCIKIRQLGYEIELTPFAKLYHLESKSRGLDTSPTKKLRLQQEITYMKTQWADQLAADPYYHPAYELYAEPYSRLRA